jgi:predicted dehydrogenase
MMVHENSRFKRPLIELKKIVESGAIGEPRYCSVAARNAYQPFAHDPVLRYGERVLLADMGPHVFDIARFLMGEIRDLSCKTQTVTAGIVGDEMASALVGFASGAMGLVSCSSASLLPDASLLGADVAVEGTKGSALLDKRGEIRLRSGEERRSWMVEVPKPAWGSRHWAISQDAVISVCRHWIEASQGRVPMQNSVEDNLKVMAAIEACYVSASKGGASVKLEDILSDARHKAAQQIMPAMTTP